jgi:hypothetical protein
MAVFPNNSQRHAIFGHSGSGKTQAGLWALQKRDYEKHPWIIFDFKRDENIARIPGIKEISINANVPKHAGLYVVRPLPELDDNAVNNIMRGIWAREKIGVFVDEGYMIPRLNTAYKALLTQGRSKKIPMITLSQSPAWISPWIGRESEFIQVFRLNTPADQKRMAEWIPGVNAEDLPQYHSYYFDVLKRDLILLRPVPTMDEILERFADKQPKPRFF